MAGTQHRIRRSPSTRLGMGLTHDCPQRGYLAEVLISRSRFHRRFPFDLFTHTSILQRSAPSPLPLPHRHGIGSRFSADGKSMRFNTDRSKKTTPDPFSSGKSRRIVRYRCEKILTHFVSQLPSRSYKRVEAQKRIGNE